MDSRSLTGHAVEVRNSEHINIAALGLAVNEDGGGASSVASGSGSGAGGRGGSNAAGRGRCCNGDSLASGPGCGHSDSLAAAATTPADVDGWAGNGQGGHESDEDSGVLHFVF